MAENIDNSTQKLVSLDQFDRLAQSLNAIHKKDFGDIVTLVEHLDEIKVNEEDLQAVEDMLGGKSLKYLTQAEYDALSNEEKEDETVVYAIIDSKNEINLEDLPCYDTRVIERKTYAHTYSTPDTLINGAVVKVSDDIYTVEEIKNFSNVNVTLNYMDGTVYEAYNCLTLSESNYSLFFEPNESGDIQIAYIGGQDVTIVLKENEYGISPGIYFFVFDFGYVAELSFDYTVSGEIKVLDEKYLVNKPGRIVYNSSDEYMLAGEIFNCDFNDAGSFSHAEGMSTKAMGFISHTEGCSTKAMGDMSHAEGCGSTANGMFSHAEGYGTVANGSSQHVQGEFNIPDDMGIYAHIVGNGDNQKTSNAHTLDWSGNAWFAGKATVSVQPTDNNDLTTKLYVDNAIAQAMLVGEQSIEMIGDLGISALHIYLPPEICVPAGMIIELYNNQCCLEADKYHVQWIGDYGDSYDWKYVIKGEQSLVGQSFTLVMNVYNDALDLLAFAETTVKIVSNTIDTNQLIIPIGDSLTNDKLWLSNIHSTLSNGKVSFRGTRGTTDPTLENGITHEGRSEARSDWYNNGDSVYDFDNNGLSTLPDVTTNPFWNPTKNVFDFDYYCNNATDGGAGYFKTSNGIDTSISPTGVMIFLGANDVSLDPTDQVANITTLVNNIRSSVKGASIPIYVVNTQFRAPYILATTSDGFATNSGGEFKFQNDIKYFNLMKNLNTELASYNNVYIVPIATTHDSAHNYPFTEVNINPYNDEFSEKKYTDTIHPMQCGYLQMAATMYGSICANYKN